MWRIRQRRFIRALKQVMQKQPEKFVIEGDSTIALEPLMIYFPGRAGRTFLWGMFRTRSADGRHTASVMIDGMDVPLGLMTRFFLRRFVNCWLQDRALAALTKEQPNASQTADR